jgi:hypothetical protein
MRISCWVPFMRTALPLTLEHKESNGSCAAARGEKETNRLRLFREPIRQGNSADGVGDVEAES